MLLANEKIELHSQGIKNTVQFKVATNAKMMRLLSDSLYSDKIAAPIRELSTNALDSHIAVGKTSTPFHVHLPCSNNPEFRIRDYGSGLSLEQLQGLYSTYGESDKNNSNDFTGCMGLGSKSPFAYTDSFTVTSYHNGQKFICITGRNDQGPTLNIMDGISTTEPNGLEVAFGVKREHFTEFARKAIDIYKHFPVYPKFTGGLIPTNKPIEQEEILLQGNGWKLCASSSSQSIAVMGHIAYPIDCKHFSKYVDNSGTWYGRYRSEDNLEAELLKMGLEIHFPIGAIEMDISRESLQYNKLTVDEIKKRLKIIGDEINVLISEHFKVCTTVWDARCLWHDLFKYGKLKDLSSVAEVVGTTWNGKDITKEISININDNLDIVSVTKGKAYTRRRTQHYINPTKNIKFYVNDVKKGAYTVAERDSNYHSNGGTDCNQIWLLTFKGTDQERADARAKLVEKIGIEDSQLIYVSTLPQGPKTVYSGSRQTKQFTYKNNNPPANYYRSHAIYSQSEWWIETTIDLSGGGYYVPLAGLRIQYGIKNKEEEYSHSMDASELANLINEAHLMGIKIPEKIHGIRPSHIKKIKDDNSWINLFDYFKNEVVAFVKKNNYVNTLEEICSITNVDSDTYLNFIKSDIDMNKPFGKFITEVARIEELKKSIGGKISHLRSVSSTVGYILPKNNNIYNFKDEEKKLQKTYPMWGMVNSHWFDKNNTKIIADYINLIDSQ